MAKPSKPQGRRGVIVIIPAIIATICFGLFAARAIPYHLDLMAHRREMAALPGLTVESASGAGTFQGIPTLLALPQVTGEDINALHAQMLQINPDYIGYIEIDGTGVNYPVLRGSDNVKYLDTAFSGDENVLGAIFMDYRCAGEVVPNIIIYGHQANDVDKNRLMFGELRDFLDEQYIAEYPVIKLMTNESIAEFEMFSARITDVTDPAYQLDFSGAGSLAGFVERNGAPPDAVQIITLSTCVGTDNYKRMIVQGALKRILPIVAAEYGENGWVMRIQE